MWLYTGLDMAAGNNVDIVLRTPYVWHEVASGSADVVISGQAFEHIPYSGSRCWRSRACSRRWRVLHPRAVERARASVSG